MAPKVPVEGVLVRELRTIPQACAQLGVTRYTLVKLWKEGKLERVRLGGQTRITARSLNALLDQVLTGESLFQKQRKGQR